MAPRKFDKKQRRSDILDAALTVFSRRGYHQSRVEDIAKEAGVSKGTIYLYFDSRESILIAAFDEFMQRFGTGVAALLERAAPPLEKIKILLRAIFSAVKENEALSRVIMDFWAASLHNPDMPHIDVSKLYSEYGMLLSDLLDEAERRGEIRADRPALTPNLIMAVADGIALHWMIDPNLFRLDQVTDQLFDLLLTGLRKP